MADPPYVNVDDFTEFIQSNFRNEESTTKPKRRGMPLFNIWESRSLARYLLLVFTDTELLKFHVDCNLHIVLQHKKFCLQGFCGQTSNTRSCPFFIQQTDTHLKTLNNF